MADSLVSYRVFIASPGGLDDIREGFRKRLQLYNETDANERGIHFKPIGWEITLAGVGRPQELINKDIQKCDYFVLVLHDRWGSPPSKDNDYTSGTEEEFDVALKCLESDIFPMRDIVLFFRAVNSRQMSDPGAQLQKVIDFKKEREEKKDLLYHSFDTQVGFEDFLNRHLAKWVRSHEEESNGANQVDTDVDASMSPVSNHGIEELLKSNEGLQKAQQYVEEKRYVEAEVEFSKLSVSGESPEALALYGRFLRKLGQVERAGTIIDRAIELSTTQERMQVRAFSLHQKARLMEEQGLLVDAVNTFRKSIVLSEMCDDHPGAAKSSRNLAKVLKKNGLLDEAQNELGKAKDYYRAAGDRSGEAGALGYLGVILKSRGDFKQAEEKHRAALEIQRELGNEGASAIALGNLGTAVRLQGRSEEGLRYHEEALEIHKQKGDLKSICRELSNLGTAFRHLGDLEKSEKYHIEALTICEEIGDKHGVAIQHGCMAQIFLKRKEYDEAEKHHLRSLKLSREMSDNQGESIQLKNLGTVYRLAGNLEKAQSVLEQGLKIDFERGFNFGVGKAKSGLGKVVGLMGKYDQSKIYLTEALAQFVESSAEFEIQETEDLINAIESKDWKKFEAMVKQ